MFASILIIPSVIIILIGLIVASIQAYLNTWELFGIVLAGLGVAIGVPSVLQKIYGKPKLIREYDEYVSERERVLIIFLKNQPLERKSFLRKLGIRRDTISSLLASFRISEKEKQVIPIMQARIYPDDDPTEAGSWRVALPPTFSASAGIMIAQWNDKKKKAIVPGDKVKSGVELSDGLYCIHIIYLVEGQEESEFREFIVGKNADDMVWVRPVG